MAINLKIAHLLCICQLCFWKLIVAFLFQSFEPLAILRSFYSCPIFFPQLNHDEYSKCSFKGSLVLILQNNEEVETMCSVVLRLSRNKDLFSVPQMYGRSLCYLYRARWHKYDSFKMKMTLFSQRVLNGVIILEVSGSDTYLLLIGSFTYSVRVACRLTWRAGCTCCSVWMYAWGAKTLDNIVWSTCTKLTQKWPCLITVIWFI